MINSILEYKLAKCITNERCNLGKDLVCLHPLLQNTSHPILGVWMEAARTVQSGGQFTETEVTTIKTSFMRHKALEALKECGILSQINYE